MSPVDNYPTDEEIARVKAWDLNDPRGWLAYCQSLWWNAEWGWPELEGEVSTGGWSGNEEIIGAMQESQQGLLWHQVWQSHRRGSHYTFSLANTFATPTPPEVG